MWMFPPDEKGNSKVPNRDYFNILVNETIKLELEIVSIAEKFKDVQPVEMTLSELASQMGDDALAQREGWLKRLNFFKEKQ